MGRKGVEGLRAILEEISGQELSQHSCATTQRTGIDYRRTVNLLMLFVKSSPPMTRLKSTPPGCEGSMSDHQRARIVWEDMGCIVCRQWKLEDAPGRSMGDPAFRFDYKGLDWP